MKKWGKSEELLIANKELALQIAEKERLKAVLVVVEKKLSSQDLEKTKLTAELALMDKEKAICAAELVQAEVEKSDRAAELVIAELEKSKRAEELLIAREEKAKLAAELIIVKADRARRAAELVIAKTHKAKSAAELVVTNLEKEKHAGDLLTADRELNEQRKEKAREAMELVIANVNKTRRNAELVIANVDKAKLAAEYVITNKEFSFQNVETAKLAAESVIADAEKSKYEAELVIANIKKAKRAAGLIIANVEKIMRAAELVIANNELVYKKGEKPKGSAAFIIANVEKAKRAAELVIANVEKAKRAAEFIIVHKEFVLKREKENLVRELLLANKELAYQIKEKERREDELIILNAELDKQYKEKQKQAAELIKAKEQAEKSDKLKTAFLTNMSHEIRTPMNGILGFAELLKGPDLSGEEQLEFIDIILVSAARMINTINNIIDVSKIESGLVNVNIKETNINGQLEFLYNFFKPEVTGKGIKFSYNCGLQSNQAIIETDREKIYAILTSLIKNSIKFTDKGSIEFGYLKKDQFLEFFVKDTGTGVSEAQERVIFDRFRQGSESLNRIYEGSGLGLSLSKSYVEMLGGKIWVKSEEAKGSVFYFTIPYKSLMEEKNIINITNSAENSEVQIRNLKILLVEDDATSIMYITRILQKFNHEVLIAKTGVEAVEACRDNPGIELVLMDIRLPVMDGYEATREIRRFNRDLIIIAQTAFGFSSDRDRAVEAGCNDYISKPINGKLLNDLINKHFNKSVK